MGTGTLYLIPTGLGGVVTPLLPAATLEVIFTLRQFVAENPKSARAFLKAAGYPQALQHTSIITLNEHTPESEIAGLMAPLKLGEDCGLLSEAGCPAVADPGAALVKAVHRTGMKVVPLVGPSALLLALMASGLNGQHFVFRGYLPVERAARAQALQEIENESGKTGAAQIFIEAPYRNDAMLSSILHACRGDTWLTIATDLTLPTEMIRTLSVQEWRRTSAELNRRPTVFLLSR